MRMPGRRTCRLLLAAFSLLLLPEAASADAIDDYLASEMAVRGIPGLALAIARDGAVVRLSSYGLAHVETASPVDPESVFAIASLDKQITAAALLRAAELGRLDLDDPVAKWVDGLLPGATLRQLLSHLSGLPDVVAGSIEGRYFTDYTTAQLLETVRGLAPLAPPGTRFAYSDAGMFLAQLATERAVGVPWWEFVRRELFESAGMSTPVSMTPGLLLPHRVSAYTLDEAGLLLRDRRLDIDFGPHYTDLGMTAADFARFLASQDGDRPLSRPSVATLTTPIRLENGLPAGEVFQWSRYGLGVGLDDFLGHRATLHSGHSGVGFLRLPDQRLSIVVFTNLEHPAGSDPVGLAMGVAGRLDPRLDLDRLSGPASVDPGLVSRLRAAYVAFLDGAPDRSRYTAPLAALAWEGAAGLAGRSVRLGALGSFEPVADGTLDGERTLLFRARHARGTIYWRVGLDPSDERISRVVWWHP
ncbi:MAG: serine hydrolase domain-containing protein [Thermoanaerobaculia bacterium]